MAQEQSIVWQHPLLAAPLSRPPKSEDHPHGLIKTSDTVLLLAQCVLRSIQILLDDKQMSESLDSNRMNLRLIWVQGIQPKK